jgi:hypothetical protein
MSVPWRRFPERAALLCALAIGVVAADEPQPLSPRNASYTIEARLDPETKMLHGRQVLSWRNLRGEPADELRFHLYWNAWRNDRSSWMLEDLLAGRNKMKGAIREEDWGWIEVDDARLLGTEETEGSDDVEGTEDVELTAAMRFESPDDGNPDDRTVLVVPLPRPVEPEETVRVEMLWRAKIPRTFARTGHRGDYYFFAHWFPKLGVYEEDGWNCHQFHAATEYYSDYGVYDVALTLPEHYVVGATGRELEQTENGDGTLTHRYYQADVHAFSWTASKEYVVREDRFDERGLPPVELRLLIQPEHLGQTERHFAAVKAALRHYGTWYGPYPYGHLTFVDPAYGSGAGGMEYPTLFTCGTRLFNPFGGDSPESVTVHETGHQFWYGIVGNNEFEHAWLDEGINTFSTQRTLDAAYDDRVYVRRYLLPPGEAAQRKGFIPVAIRDITVPRYLPRLNSYRKDAGTDYPETPSFLYHPKSGRTLTYGKTVLWLTTLERELGWETLQAILSTFFQRHSFGHPGPEEFFAVADEVSGEDLSWFFDQIYRDSVRFDYAVDSAISVPARAGGFVDGAGGPEYAGPRAEEDDEADLYRTEVVVRRRGGGRFPVDVLLVFEDGTEQRERWDGEAHWTKFVVERPVRLEYAVVDPGRVLILDLNYTNNSRRVEPAATLPAYKWGSRWMVWFQDLLATFAFFV